MSAERKEERKKIDYLNYTQLELDELLEQSQNGSYYEFGELSQFIRDVAHSYYLTKHRLNEIRNMEDVADLTNTVFLAFAEEYQKIENVGYWLRRILFVTFIKWFKKNKTRDSLKQKSFINKNNGNGRSEDLIGADIVKILNTFPDEKQKIVRLKAWGELDFHQIARIINKGEKIIIKIYYQTLITLKNRLR